MRTIEEISDITGIPEHNILNIYAYGSEVYGTNTAESDEDYIIVRDGLHAPSDIRNGSVDVTIYDAVDFQHLVDNHYIANLECLWLPEKLKIEHITFKFELDKVKLRHSISNRCSLSFGKCGQRLDPGHEFYDPYSAKKSLWHAIRIAQYGIQLATMEEIFDYGMANVYRPQILEMPDNWKEIKKVWQPVFNNWMTQFRKLAPKE